MRNTELPYRSCSEVAQRLVQKIDFLNDGLGGQSVNQRAQRLSGISAV